MANLACAQNGVCCSLIEETIRFAIAVAVVHRRLSAVTCSISITRPARDSDPQQRSGLGVGNIMPAGYGRSFVTLDPGMFFLLSSGH